MKRPNQKKVIINVNEVLLTPCFLVYLFNDKSEVNINGESNTAHKTLTVSPATEKTTAKLSQPNKGQTTL